jgi:hypothetical protein
MFKFIVNTAKKTGSFIKNSLQKAGSFIKNTAHDVYHKIFHIPSIGDFVSKTMPPLVKKYLDQYGDTIINKIEIFRRPIPSFIDTAANFITFGKWDELKKKYGYDKFFHLGILLNDKIQLERDQVMKLGDKKYKGTEQTITIPVAKKITLRELLENAINKFGPEIYHYNAFKNNCQNFCIQVLSASDLLTTQAQQFILQPVDKLIKELPEYIAPVANTLTDLGNVVETVKQHLQ